MVVVATGAGGDAEVGVETMKKLKVRKEGGMERGWRSEGWGRWST